jgi:hypothetical protein
MTQSCCPLLLFHIWHFGVYYWWQSIDGKNELILWKLSYIWMKILNDIACNDNWVKNKILKVNSNSTKFKFLNWNLYDKNIEIVH